LTVQTGRLGWIALSVETTPGAPTAPVDYIPFLDCSLSEKINVLDDASARGTRDMHPENSQLGKQWGEGSLKVNLDAKLSGYLVKAVMGNDSPVSEGNGVYTHTLTEDGSNNNPTSLSIIVNRSGVDKLLFPYSVVNSLELSFSDGFAELNASIMSRFPSASNSGVLVTNSGFYYAFRHATIQVGSNITNAANSPTPLKIRNFKVTVNNNSEAQFVAGNRDVDSYIQKSFEVKGSFVVAFEDTTQRDAFYNLTKQAMIVNFLGNGIGNAMNEFVKLRFYKIRTDENKINLPPNDYVSQNISFTAEYSSGDSATMDWVIRNTKASY
jgi:hypothetical protein